jgi:hypothetical protein
MPSDPEKQRPAGTARDAEEAWYWSCWQEGPWSRPATLPTEAIDRIRNTPRAWLSDAVDLMAFGGAVPPRSVYEIGARRRQASRALSEAARLEIFSLLGCPDKPGDKTDRIPPAYFDMPRHLGDEDSLQTDLSLVSEEEFTAAHFGQHHRWFNVRVETKAFLKWLTLHPVLPKPAPLEKDKGGRPPEYDWEAVRAFTLALVKQRGKPHKTNRLLRSKTELVEAILNEWANEKDIHLAQPTVRKRVNLWLACL